MFEFDKTDIETPVIENPVITDSPKPRLALETQRVPLDSVITHVSGSKWVIEYYRQYLTKDMQPTPLDLERDPVNQQYLKINDLEVRVEQALSPQQDDATKEFTMSGSATVFPGMIPIKGDMFIANTGDGQYTLFTVTRTNRLTNTLDSLYNIEYLAVSVLYQEHLDNLTEKTSKETVFNKDFISVGKNPLLSLAEDATYAEALEKLAGVTRYYFDRFFDNRFDCFTIPGLDNQTAFDPFLNEFVLKIIAKRDYPQYNKVQLFNTHSIASTDTFTVLDYLLENNVNINIASYIDVHYLPNVPTTRFQYYSKGIETSGIDYAVLVTKTPENRLEELRWLEEPEVPLQMMANSRITVLDFKEQQYSATLQITHPLFEDRYIFSSYFYDKDYGGMSVVEKMVSNAINGKEIGPTSVMILIDYLIGQASLVESYYLLPIAYRLLERSLSELT